MKMLLVMFSNPNYYALILAGGSGTRFWPLSRNAKPKQLLKLFGEDTLLDQTIKRLEGLIPLENIFILTNQQQEQAVREIACQLPAENIFAEPAKRDTAAAVALGTALIETRNPNATMMVLPADHLIQDVQNYQHLMSNALKVASESDGLVTIGIRPTWACPSYGYIERGAAIDEDLAAVDCPVYEVKRFREKPSSELAEQFLSKGGFSWNAGMFVWSISSVKAQLQKHTPALADFINQVVASSDIPALVQAEFPKLKAISVDYALMECADRVLNLEANFDWDDVGSWISVAKYLEKTASQNEINCPISEYDASNNIIFNNHKGIHIALLGVSDLIVVQTKDALLVANRHQADAIKKLSDLLPQDLL